MISVPPLSFPRSLSGLAATHRWSLSSSPPLLWWHNIDLDGRLAEGGRAFWAKDATKTIIAFAALALGTVMTGGCV
jgi:hypothetical protein